MGWSHCYGFMVTCLVGVGGYSAYKFYCPPGTAESMLDKGLVAFGVKPHVPSREPVSLCDGLVVGQPRVEVAATLAAQAETQVPKPQGAPQIGASQISTPPISQPAVNKPQSIDSGPGLASKVLVFKNDRLAGWVEGDPDIAVARSRVEVDSLIAQGKSTRSSKASRAHRSGSGASASTQSRYSSGRSVKYQPTRYFKSKRLSTARFYKKPEWLKTWSSFRDAQRHEAQRTWNARLNKGSRSSQPASINSRGRRR